MSDQKPNKKTMRVLRFLARGPAECRAAAGAGKMLLDGGDRGMIGADVRLIGELAASGLIFRSRTVARLSEAGRVLLDREEGDADRHRAQHQDRGEAVMQTPAGRERVIVNHSESPLAALARRRSPNGEPFLSAGEFRAGERLRADYTRGLLLARTGVDWGSAGAGSDRNYAVNGIAELTDAALAARQRVDRAIGAVGPELAGLLVDVCCFLKGLEHVEAERRWPQRSAKIVLKTALGALARHYEPDRRHQSERILHWGAAGYRPSLSS